MTTFLLILQAIIGAALVGVILMQQSEGGGLGMGGSPSGLMSARGAADFLTRATAVLASVFVALSIVQAVLATRTAAPVIDTTLARPVTSPPPGPAPAAPAAPDAANGSAPLVPLATDRPVVQTQAPVPTTPRVVTTARERTPPSDAQRPAQRTPRPAATSATPEPSAAEPATTAPVTTPPVPIAGGNAN